MDKETKQGGTLHLEGTPPAENGAKTEAHSQEPGKAKMPAKGKAVAKGNGKGKRGGYRRRHYQGAKLQGVSALEALFAVVSNSRKGPGGTAIIPAQVYAKAQAALRAAVA